LFTNISLPPAAIDSPFAAHFQAKGMILHAKHDKAPQVSADPDQAADFILEYS
jgi:hypothetical protein